MAAPEDKKKVTHISNTPVEAINTIAATKAGKDFFRWMAGRCFAYRSTIVGNPQTFEVNMFGSVAQEFLRKLFLEIYRAIKPELRINIDYPPIEDKTDQDKQ